MSEHVITTNPALCQDCYSCVRHCGVKAIKVKDGQAQVVPELCISCGTCIRVCPQNAKSAKSDRPAIYRALEEGRRVVASVAPSIPTYFDLENFTQVEDTLKKLGFFAAEETAVGADIVARAHREYVDSARDRWPIIASSCPVVVNLIESYYPDLIPNLAPIVSPMVAHARLLKQKYGDDAFIVFIGPCVGKKSEAHTEPMQGEVHAALTFLGLREWLAESGVTWAAPREVSGGKATEKAAEKARLFPIEGGLIGTAGMHTDILDGSMVAASGFDSCRGVLDDIRSGRLNASIVELMACEGGCVNGSVMVDRPYGIYLARQKIIDFQGGYQPSLAVSRDKWPDLHREYRDRKEPIPEFSEEEIRGVLQQINKYSPEDELNCGACGYSSCREKAVATLRGMAEVTMCIPYMRRRSESLRQVVWNVTPNAIIILDDNLEIQDMSPSAEKLLNTDLSSVQGSHLSGLIGVVDDFVHVRDTGRPVIGKTRRLKDDLVAELTIVHVEDQKLMMAIIRDITEREKERESFRTIRTQTLESAREVLSRQMRVAHEIAHLIGETTAESKTIVSHLANLLEEDDNK